MDFFVATFAAVFLLLASASCAPTAHTLHGACADVRSSSLELNRMAKNASVEARNGSTDVADFSSSLLWVDTKDNCNPENLKHNSGPCLGKMLGVLTNYISAVKRVSAFQSCQASARVQPAIHKLHTDMSRCVQSKTGKIHQKDPSNDMTEPIPRWQEKLLCHYTLDRLFSFSILTARVFAVGDPAGHAVGSTQKCM